MTEQEKIRKKTKILIAELNNKLIERERITPALLLALYSHHHILLLGPPGTGKTYAIELMANFIKDAKYFEYLITPTTTPDELFGTKFMEANGSVSYNIEHSMLDSHIVFNDEIYKAPSTLLNSMLGITHSSRSFHQRGRGKLKAKMILMAAASNELPSNDAVEAFEDRLILKFWVDEISDPENFKKFTKREFDRTKDFSVNLTVDEITDVKNAAVEVFIHDNLVTFLSTIKNMLKTEKVRISDRKLSTSLDILQVSAYVNCRDRVDVSDLFILLDIAWRHFDDIDRTKRIIFDSIFGNPTKIAEVLKTSQDGYKVIKSKITGQIGNVLNYSYNFYGSNSEIEFLSYRNLVEELYGCILELNNNCAGLKNNYSFCKDVEILLENNIFTVDYKNHIYIDSIDEIYAGEKKINKNDIFNLASDVLIILTKLRNWLEKNKDLYDYNNNRLIEKSA